MPGFVQVLDTFGKVWKLIMPLSRPWKVLERFYEMAIEKFWMFVWENSKIFQNGYDIVGYETPCM